MDLFSLEGKVAVVTGASRGLGQAMAVGLAAAGADIVTIDRTGKGDTGEQVMALGRRYHALTGDMAEMTAAKAEEMVAEVVQLWDRLDILVNNAGTTRRAPIFEYQEADWHHVIQVNLTAVFLLSQAAARQMKKQGKGKIITTASVLSFQGGILIPPYTAAKSGIRGLTKALANELAPHQINVNAIAPGYMATELTAPLQNDEVRNQAILDRIPAGRWGESADLQGATIFLASAASDYVHGVTLPVDGGWLGR